MINNSATSSRSLSAGAMKRMIWMMLLLNAIIIIGGSMLMPLWSTYVHSIGGDVRTAGQAICTFSIIIGLLTVACGKFESRYDADPVFLILSASLICFAYMGYFFIHHPWQLYIVQSLLGLACALQVPALCATYQRSIVREQANFGWGLWTASYNISVGISALLSAYIAHHFGVRLVFVCMNALSWVSLGVSIWVAIKGPPEALYRAAALTK